MKKGKLSIDEIAKALEATPDEYWEKAAERIKAMYAEMDRKCASGDHQGTLSNPIFSGADIWWQCSFCKGRVLQVGGNRPMTL